MSEGTDGEGGSPFPEGEAVGAIGAVGAMGAIDALDVVVLAGGTGRRLGGASKPDVVVRGARLLDHLLAGLAALAESLAESSCPAGSTGPAQWAGRVGRPAAPGPVGFAGPSGTGDPAPGRVVVVAPERVALPAGVLRALEDPPLGGPVAGIAAGLARLAEAPGPEGPAGPAALTAVVTCDAPESWRVLPVLVTTARGPGSVGDGACVLAGDHVQYLLGVYRTAPLTRCVAPDGVALRDVPVREALGGLAVTHVDPGDLRAAARDLDTWEEIRAWARE